MRKLFIKHRRSPASSIRMPSDERETPYGIFLPQGYFWARTGRVSDDF